VSGLHVPPPPGFDRSCVEPLEIYSPAQRALWLDTRPYIIVPAGRRSGKTHIATWACAREVAQVTPRFRRGIYASYRLAVLAAPTRPQAKYIWWDRIKSVIPRQVVERVSEGELALWLKTGWIVRVAGMERPQRAVGRPIDLLILDEYASMKPTVFTQWLRPAMDTRGHRGRVWLIGVPEGRNHYWERWCDAQLQTDRWGAHTWKSREVLEPSVIEQAMRDLDPREFRQQYEASFEDNAGRVYWAFDRQADVHEFPFQRSVGSDAWPWLGGMDFNVDPMTAVWGWEEPVRAPDGAIETHAFVWDCLAIPNADTAKAGREILTRCADARGRTGPGTFVMHPDPSGQARHTSQAAGRTDHAILRELGFKTSARSHAPARRDRWNATNAMFCNAKSRRRTHIHPRCTRLIRDLEGAVYAEGTSEPDERKCGQMLHITDATGYWFELRYGVGASGVGGFDPRAAYS
jgi:hypothetical protein